MRKRSKILPALAVVVAALSAVVLSPSVASAGFSQDLPSIYLMADGHPRGKAKYAGTCDWSICGFNHVLHAKVGGTWYTWTQTATTASADDQWAYTQNTGNYCVVGATWVSVPYRNKSNLIVTNVSTSTISDNLSGSLAFKIFSFSLGGTGTYTITTSSTKTITTYSAETSLVCS